MLTAKRDFAACKLHDEDTKVHTTKGYCDLST
jgi:hypothetical protein